MRIDEFSNSANIDGTVSTTEITRFMLFGFDITVNEAWRELKSLASVITKRLSKTSLITIGLSDTSSITTTLSELSAVTKELSEISTLTIALARISKLEDYNG